MNIWQAKFLSEQAAQKDKEPVLQASSDSESQILGRIDSVSLVGNPDGTKSLKIEGWFIYSSERVVSLQFAIPDSPIILSSRHKRPDIAREAKGLPDSECAGYVCRLPLQPTVHQISGVHFFALLETGATIAGYMPIPSSIDIAAEGIPGSPPVSDVKEFSETGSSSYLRLKEIQLDHFLQSGASIEYPVHSSPPRVSVIIPLYNQAELTLNCLQSLLSIQGPSFEVIAVDNASTDRTSELLKRVQGAVVVQNEMNRHFIYASNQGAEKARGEYLLFLNNDTAVTPGAIQAALQCFEEERDVGAVGGRIVTPDGVLQEAGSAIFPDGSAHAYGRGEDPLKPEFRFRRRVDFCSGAFLLTPRSLFLEHEGFDKLYSPAYYEDADYCFRLFKAGHHTFYEPNALVTHVEHGSSSQSEARQYQIANRSRFISRFGRRIHNLPSSSNLAALFCRDVRWGMGKHRVLVIEDQVPLASKGSGFPRTAELLRSLVEQEFLVTLFPTCLATESWHEIYDCLPSTIEVIQSGVRSSIGDFVRARDGFYDLIIVCRPHNMEAFQEQCPEYCSAESATPVIYDAEAIYARRELARLELESGIPATEEEEQYILSKETQYVKNSSLILTVSENEAKDFNRFGYEQTAVLGHAVEVDLGEKKFSERTGLLFVGPLYEDDTPNTEGFCWYLEEVHPKLEEALNCSIPITHIGICDVILSENNVADSVTFMGAVDDLMPFYNNARLFIAPLRFSAGIPLKIIDSAAHGLPVVCHDHLRKQLGWQNGEQLLAATSAEEYASMLLKAYTTESCWEKLRSSALERVKSDYSRRQFRQRVGEIIDSVRLKRIV